MSFLSRFQAAVPVRIEPTVARAASAVRNETVDSSKITRGSFIWEALAGQSGVAAPTPLTEGEAYSVTAVSASVQLISGAIASLPAHVYQRSDDGDLTRDQKTPLWWVLNEQFSPRWTAAAGWWFMTASKLLYGDAFAEIRRDMAGRVIGILPVHPNRVRVVTDPEGWRLIYVISPDPTVINPSEDARKVRVIDSDDMLHVPGFGFNGTRGLSMLRYALRTAGPLAKNADVFSAQFLKNQARPDFSMSTDNNLTDDQFDRLEEMLEKHRGPENAGKPMILEGGLKINSLTMPLEDVQLLETRKFQVEEIARAFMVPPFMIGHTEKTSSWGTGVEAMGAGFVRYTLRDHLVAFHNELNRKLFPRAPYVIEFDTTELERGDTKAMFSAVRIGLGRAGEPAFLSVEEGRSILRLPRKMQGTDPTISKKPKEAA